MNKTISTLLYIFLFGFNYCYSQDIIKILPKKRVVNEALLNTILNNEIGEKLVTLEEEEYQDALRIVELPKFRFGLVKYGCQKDDLLALSGETKNYFLYYNIKNITNGDIKLIEKTYYHNYLFGVAVSKDNNEFKPFVYDYNGYVKLITKNVKGLEVEKDIFINKNCENCFKQEFVFNGKLGSSLKFIYREYINDMARPAFNQELQYDLNDSNIIGFKGLRIEVIKATNTNIEYKILNNFIIK